MRKVMVEVACSRCERKETAAFEPVTSDQKAVEADTPPAFTARLYRAENNAVVVGFEDLCVPCRRSVEALLEQIGKRIEGVSPDRTAKPKKPKATKENPAPPAPGSPPKPATGQRKSSP